MDEDKKGWLDSEDVFIALRGVNSHLTDTEEQYLVRVSGGLVAAYCLRIIEMFASMLGGQYNPLLGSYQCC